MRTRANRGVTLIELLVSTAILGFATLAITAGFVALNKMVAVDESIRAGQASTRNAVQLISSQLRIAGYGIEPPLAFGFPTDWKGKGPNQSDRLVFHARNPNFRLAVAEGGASTSAIDIDTTRTPLRSTLKAGQIIQIVCPGASVWSYGVLSDDVLPGATTLPLAAPTNTFPRTNGRFAEPCFSGAPGVPAWLFKVDRHEYWVEEITVGVDQTSPYLLRALGDRMEPIAENIEAFRVTFFRADGTSFIPDPDDPAPTYETERDDPLRQNENPANIRMVRVGLVGRTSAPDRSLREAHGGQAIPAFGGVDEIVFTDAPRRGFRRFLFETSVRVRNLDSTTMFIPPYTADTATPDVCKGVPPADGLNCSGG